MHWSGGSSVARVRRLVTRSQYRRRVERTRLRCTRQRARPPRRVARGRSAPTRPLEHALLGETTSGLYTRSLHMCVIKESWLRQLSRSSLIRRLHLEGETVLPREMPVGVVHHVRVRQLQVVKRYAALSAVGPPAGDPRWRI